MSDVDKQILAEIPVGKLTGTIKTTKDENGNNFKSATFKCSTADLHAWEQREHGIDDNIRAALAARNDALEMMMSDFTTKTLLDDPSLNAVNVDLGMGNGAENFTTLRRKVSFYPEKKEDGTIERAEKITFGAMKHTTNRIITKAVRQYHETNQTKLEEDHAKHFSKAAVK